MQRKADDRIQQQSWFKDKQENNKQKISKTKMGIIWIFQVTN